MDHRLLLLRHAKSSWGDPALPDHERRLAPRGRRAAEKMARYLREAGVRADLVLCSSARRTRETLELLAPVFDAADVLVEDRLYGTGEDAMLERLREVPESVGDVALIGHNPGMWDLAVGLAGSGRGLPAERLREKFPTGALALFELDGPWSQLAPARARLVSFVVPRELR